MSFLLVIQINNGFVRDCPPSQTYTTGIGQTSRIVTWTPEPTADDGFGNVVPLSRQTHTSGSAFPLGVTFVQYLFQGNNNLILDCSFTITVMSMCVLVIVK